MKITFTIHPLDLLSSVRSPAPHKPTKAFKNKKKYSRKPKHKEKVSE